MSAGITSQISVGLESTWGTAVVPNKSIGVKPGDGIQTDNDIKYISDVRANLAKNFDSFIGARKHEGGYEMDFAPGNMGYYLKSAMGAVSSAVKGGESIVYEHTLTIQEAKPSLTIEQAVTDIVNRYAGCIITGFKFSCKDGESLVLSITIKGKSQATATKITAAYETSVEVLNFAHLGVSGFQIGGSPFVVNNFELEFKNGVEYKHALGDNNPQFSYSGRHELLAKIELYANATNAAKYTDYLANTNRALDITFTGSNTIGTSSKHGLNINVPRMSFKTGAYPITEDSNLITLDGEGIYDTVTSKLMSMKLTNLLANYN